MATFFAVIAWTALLFYGFVWSCTFVSAIAGWIPPSTEWQVKRTSVYIPMIAMCLLIALKIHGG